MRSPESFTSWDLDVAPAPGSRPQRAASMASSYTATDPQAYEQLMGRWSGLLAEQLIAFTGIETSDHLLDVGCGTGRLALALAAHPEPARIVGMDIAVAASLLVIADIKRLSEL